MKTAPLSYTSQFGYYGLRVNPTFEQVSKSVYKPARVPIPDRSALHYAMSLERGYILDQAKAGTQQDRAVLNYRESQAQLPEAAARVLPSSAGEDELLDRISQGTDALHQQAALELAKEAQSAEHRRQTAEMRREQLAATHGAWNMHPTVEAAHEELDEAGVPHEMPLPRLAPPMKAWPAPAPQYAAAGQLQAPEFKSFEILNGLQPESLRAARVTHKQGLTYEHLRDLVVEPTWSS